MFSLLSCFRDDQAVCLHHVLPYSELSTQILHWVNFVFRTGPGTFPVQKTPASATEQIRFGRSRLTLLEPSRQFLALVHPPTLLSFFLSLWRLQRTIIGCRSVSCWPGRCGSFRLETCDESTDMIRIGKLGRHVLDILYSDVVSK